MCPHICVRVNKNVRVYVCVYSHARGCVIYIAHYAQMIKGIMYQH